MTAVSGARFSSAGPDQLEPVLAGRRILVAHPSPDLYGSDRALLRALHALRAAGAHVEVIMPEVGPLNDELAANAFSVATLPFPVLRKALLRPSRLLQLPITSARAVSHLRREICRRSPHLVYVNTVTLPHWLLAARSTGVPVVCHVRELESQLRRGAATALLSPLLLADGVIANSEATRQFLCAAVAPLDRRTRVIYNGFKFPGSPVAPPEGLPVRVALVGRLSPRKGQDVAISALSRLREKGHQVDLDLIGSAYPGYEWFTDSLKSQAQDLGVAAHVHFTGFQRDVTSAYTDAAVVLVPSRLEPFGNVAVEALGMGRPVVASRVGGLPEIVRDGETGYLVPPSDDEALARAVERLIKHPEKAAAMGAMGASDVRARFSLQGAARALPAFLASVL